MKREKIKERKIGKFEVRLDCIMWEFWVTMSCDGTRLSETKCASVTQGNDRYLAMCLAIEDVIRCMKQDPKVGDEA